MNALIFHITFFEGMTSNFFFFFFGLRDNLSPDVFVSSVIHVYGCQRWLLAVLKRQINKKKNLLASFPL